MTTRFGVIGTVALLALPFTAGLAGDAGLGGSMSSMRRQYEVAKKNDYTFLRTPAQVRAFVREDHLEPLESNDHLLVHKVSFPYARPAVKLFVLRLAEQYHAATGERLVVTSLTRPVSSQPRNAHDLSVHPAGMAVDLRIPKNATTRAWLESTLLSLEARELLDATRERRPPHYHVAVFPAAYRAYVDRVGEVRPVTVTAPAPIAPTPVAATPSAPAAVLSLAPVSSPQAAPPLALLATLGLGMVGLTALVANVRGRTARTAAAPAGCASLLGVADRS